MTKDFLEKKTLSDQSEDRVPLFVDLDGTLVKSDLLIESVILLLKVNPLNLLLMLRWLFLGKAKFKHRVFSKAAINVESLPYNDEFLDFLKQEFKSGRKLILATASPLFIARKIAQHLGIFSDVMGSTENLNLSGTKKAEVMVEQLGERGFAYAGNAAVDLKVWKWAKEGYLVYPPFGLEFLASSRTDIKRVFNRKRSLFRLVLKEMRPHQWVKNLLIFAPIILSNRLSDFEQLWLSLVAFIAFSLLSSSVYIINDVLDLDADRWHPDNKKRPFASGDLPLIAALFLAPFLFTGGLLLGAFLSIPFLKVLLGYFALTTAYSLSLKKVVLADIIVLASLYSWRIFAGSVVTDINLTDWFLTFSTFLFISLALLKRCAELMLLQRTYGRVNPRRGYRIEDLLQLTIFGTASGYISVLVFALYLTSDQIREHYQSPQYLWFVCPFLFYWISRMWLKMQHGKMTTDPVIFALKDRASYLVLSFLGVIWFLSN